MMVFIPLFTLLGIVALFCALWALFVRRVCGVSMYPTLKDGDILLVRPVLHYKPPKEGKIYGFRKENKPMIKRLHAYYPGLNECYFVGDNAAKSYDSRMWGTFPWKKVRFVVVAKICNISGATVYYYRKEDRLG